MLEEEKKYLTKCLENFTKIDDKVIKGSDIMLATLTKAVLSIEERLEKITVSTPTTTLRDQFAGQALAGMLANSRNNHGYKPRDGREDWHSAIAEESYEIADAMLKERNK